MKVLHVVSGSLKGGAARGALWLHNALLEGGVDSYIVTNSKFAPVNSKNIIFLTRSWFLIFRIYCYKLIEKVTLRSILKNNSVLFSTGFFGLRIDQLDIAHNVDVINLHWVNASLVSMKGLSKVNTPLVWTLRDMWPLTGGCHYSLDCKKYENGCGNCPLLLNPGPNDISAKIVNRKKKYIPPNTTIVGISEWLTDAAKKSPIFKNNPSFTISNCIEVNSFEPLDKAESRKLLKIPNSKKYKIILLGCTNNNDEYKGFEYAVDAISKLDSNKYIIILFGKSIVNVSDKFSQICLDFGFVADSKILNQLYSAADLFVAPSVMEAFGKTIVESLLSGTPVVSFDSTGPKTLINHKDNGYLAKYKDVADLSKGIKCLANQKYDSNFSRRISEEAKNLYNCKLAAIKYYNLYKDILSKSN